MGTQFVVGVDSGGTSTRALASTLDGRRLGTGNSGGGNPNSHQPVVAAGHVAEALRAAMAGLDPADAVAGVLGLAGSSKLSDENITAIFASAWESTGLRCPMLARPDSEVAFAAATSEPNGTALVAGTGSIAAAIENRRTVRTAGGFGWLLGDEGSSYWLGREAIRVTLQQLQHGQPMSPLAVAVLTKALPDQPPAELGDTSNAVQSGGTSIPAEFARLITAVKAAPPIELATFATLVTAKAGEDEAAQRILASAVRILTDLAVDARPAVNASPAVNTNPAVNANPAVDASPIVLIGGLIGQGGPLSERVRAALATRTGAPVLTAGDGAAGAAWLAAVEVLGDGAAHPNAGTSTR